MIGTTLPAWARHAAAVVLPIANFAEEEGTFTNLRGRVQRFLQAKAAPGFARPSWFVLVRSARARRASKARLLARERSVRRARGGAAGVRRHVLRRARTRAARSIAGATAGATA